MSTTVQIVGALLVLAGFAAAQLGRWSTESIPYLATNLVGASLLAVTAVASEQWGFLLLNATWAAVALVGMVGALRRHGRPPAHEHPPLPPT